MRARKDGARVGKGGGETRTQVKQKSIFWVNSSSAHTFIRTVQPHFSTPEPNLGAEVEGRGREGEGRAKDLFFFHTHAQCR